MRIIHSKPNMTVAEKAHLYTQYITQNHLLNHTSSFYGICGATGLGKSLIATKIRQLMPDSEMIDLEAITVKYGEGPIQGFEIHELTEFKSSLIIIDVYTLVDKTKLFRLDDYLNAGGSVIIVSQNMLPSYLPSGREPIWFKIFGDFMQYRGD